MSYQLKVNITNHPNGSGYDLNAKNTGDASSGEVTIYEAGRSIASGSTATPAFKAYADGNDVIQGTVYYQLPDVEATMLIKYGTKKYDAVGISPGAWGFSLFVELQNNDGSLGFNDYFAIVRQPWGGSSSSDHFEASIDLYQAGAEDYGSITTHTPAPQYTTVKLFNNTDEWVTLKDNTRVEYGYDCVTGGTTCVPPGETLLIYSITKNQPDATLKYNLTNDREFFITAKYDKEPYYSWADPGAGSYRLDCDSTGDNEYTYTLSQN